MGVYDVTSHTSYPTLSAAIVGSSANDVIQITGGSYVENFPDITHSLDIMAVGGLAYLSTPLPDPANDRAILRVPFDADVSLTISGLALSGAVDSADNGAGILFGTGNANLVVNDCWIYDNQDGILTGGADAASINGMTVTIDNSEIDDNGTPPSNPRYGFDHNLYIGAVNQLTVTNSYIHDALGGHEIKSRALNSTILDNRIFDGPTAGTSYSIDLSDGGIGVVSGNIIEKGPSAQNKYIIHFAGESGITYPDSSLLVSNNTIINDRSSAVLLLNQSQSGLGQNIPATISGNTLYDVATSSLFVDKYGLPHDLATNNTFISGPGPALDTSHPFSVPPLPAPEPSGLSLLPFAMLASAVLRRLRTRTSRAQRACWIADRIH